MQLAKPREGERDLPIEVLIGGECYWRIVKDASTIRLSSIFVLLPTMFGWILTGSRMGIAANQKMVNHVSLEHFDKDLRKLWELETIGITPNKTTRDNRRLRNTAKIPRHVSHRTWSQSIKNSEEHL
jgi:hypothetical protein